MLLNIDNGVPLILLITVIECDNYKTVYYTGVHKVHGHFNIF